MADERVQRTLAEFQPCRWGGKQRFGDQFERELARRNRHGARHSDLRANLGSLVDDNGAAVNITGQRADLTGKSGIGTSVDPIDTTVAELAATASDPAAGIRVNETDGLSSVSVKTKNGDATINFSGGPLTFTASTDVLSASGAAVVFEDTGGDVALGLVDAGSSAVSITAFGAIRDDTNDSMVDLRGGAVTLKAGHRHRRIGKRN